MYAVYIQLWPTLHVGHAVSSHPSTVLEFICPQGRALACVLVYVCVCVCMCVSSYPQGRALLFYIACTPVEGRVRKKEKIS